MRLCRVTKSLPSKEDPGAGFHAYLLTKEIHEPTLIITRKGSDPYRYPLPAHAVVTEITFRDVPFTPALGTGFLQNGAIGLKQKIRVWVKLIHKLKETVFFIKSIPHMVRFKPAIVHVDGLLCILCAIFAKTFLGSRAVVTLHSVTEASLVNKFRVLGYLLNYSDKIICVSNAVKAKLIKVIAAEKMEVISSGVDLEIFNNHNISRKNQLIAVGNFKWQKGYLYLLQALAGLSNFNEYQLLIIGDGPERNMIEAEINRLNLTDRVRLLGVLDQSEIAKHLNESKLFIMSSLVEGFPRVLLEAVACATPSVVTTSCNAEGLIERVGIAVEPGNGKALAEAVEKLLSNENRWNSLSKNCVEVAQEYGWELIVNKTKDVYRCLGTSRMKDSMNKVGSYRIG